MYKNVLNQYTIGTILLLSSYFTSRAQKKSESFPKVYAGTDTRSDHPPPDATITAKPAEADTTWKPLRRLWGYAFGDYYYNSRADASNRSAETNHNGVPTYRNVFQFRRTCLGYDYYINKTFTAGVLPASGPGANTARKEP